MAHTYERIEVFISAPNGCASALELLKCLNEQLDSSYCVTILENFDNCSNINLPEFEFILEHAHYLTLEEAEMRRDSFLTSKSEWLVYLEDHVLIGSTFIKELHDYISNSRASGAATFYAVNGTPKSLGSRTLFSWVWGMAESKLFPQKPEPVCSAFVLNRSSVSNHLKSANSKLKIGELETKLIPEIINNSDSDFMTFMEVSHFEYVGLRVGALAIYSNSRIMGHLEKQLIPSATWPFHMFSRYMLRPLRIHKKVPKTYLEICCLYYVACVGLVGVIAGRLFGIWNADINLAKAHPKIS